ncbi:MAG: hypothetical protein COU47_02330 [Candidatus Niyogibacteria bacterium CG10_big_fil_rev_8_21_14_0_10_46_36]|uniref:Uncharacterized protein n=1 Tax=Candidatus Niyogibacteria bacterium CG10_big_fil_rev_8_21_14_0_10_46_36 TaxID=1974726 RepID=A0A2H0TDD0_9BACT|nr:MAG: hypothetical protein COU47_02330 [Candidatus Niyogibacteria bacterium CG10_big_fil_rev_8_21_14_0_10_46_36]
MKRLIALLMVLFIAVAVFPVVGQAGDDFGVIAYRPKEKVVVSAGCQPIEGMYGEIRGHCYERAIYPHTRNTYSGNIYRNGYGSYGGNYGRSKTDKILETIFVGGQMISGGAATAQEIYDIWR